MKARYQEFSVRLRECLVEKGLHKHFDQVRHVAKAAAVTERTASRYIKGESRLRYLDDHLGGLADFLGVLPIWLVAGDGPRTVEERDRLVKYMQKVQTMPKYFQDKLRRASLLRMNGSRREYRLMGFVMSGQISLFDYLDMV